MKKLGMLVLALGSMGSLGILGAGCGGGGGGGGPGGLVSHPLQGASQIDIPAGSCIIVNTYPENIPASSVSYDLVDQYGDDNYEVGVVPSSYTCQFPPSQAFVDDTFVGSFNAPAASVPAGTYDLDIICQNALQDCLVTSISWEATY